MPKTRKNKKKSNEKKIQNPRKRKKIQIFLQKVQIFLQKIQIKFRKIPKSTKIWQYKKKNKFQKIHIFSHFLF